MLKTVTHVGAFLAAVVRSFSAGTLTQGAVCGIVLCTLSLQAILLLGLSPVVVTGVLLAGCTGVGLGMIVAATSLAVRSSSRSSVVTILAAGTLALVATFAPTIVAGMSAGIDAGYGPRGETFPQDAALLTLLCLPLIGIPASACSILSTTSRSTPQFLIGMAIGSLANGFLIAPTFHLQWGAYAGAVSCMIVFAVTIAVRRRTTARISDPFADPSAATFIVAPRSKAATLSETVFGSVIASCAGGLAIVCLRMLQQFSPENVFMICAYASGLLGTAGLTAGFLRLSSRSILSMLTLAAAIGAVSLAAAAPQLIRVSLWMSANAVDAATLAACRAVFAIVFAIPAGVLIAAGLHRLTEESEPGQSPTGPSPNGLSPNGLTLRAGLAAAGTLIAATAFAATTMTLLLPSLGVATSLILIAGGVAAIELTQFALMEPSVSGRWRGGLSLAATAALVAASFSAFEFSSASTTRVLFSTSAFLASRSGFNIPQLRKLDDARLLGEVETGRSSITVWKHAAYQLQLRENGVPRGVASLRSDLFPEFSGDVLPVVLPMVLHAEPRRVLLVGGQAGVGVSTALRFPVDAVVCAEGDSTTRRLIETEVWSRQDNPPGRNPLFTWLPVDAPFAPAAAVGEFDVITSFADHGSLLRSQAVFTTEFYRRAAAKLSTGGVFCQRISCIDIGPDVFLGIVAAIQSVFDEVRLIEVGAADYVLISSKPGSSLLRPGLADRLQRRHVRDILGEVGIDWCVPLNLPNCEPKPLEMLVAERKWSANTAATGRLAFLLPIDVMRWSNKAREFATVFSPHPSSLLIAMGDEARDNDDLGRRLTELDQQQQFLVRSMDQYWNYRAELKRETRVKARRGIVPVAGGDKEEGATPTDRQRLEYWEALAQARKTKSPEDIDALARTAVPYDPLISYFWRLEAADLESDADAPRTSAELAHRLHAVYFASPSDRTLMPVWRALKLLSASPDAEPDPRHRFDLYNSLLQVLQIKWELRAGQQLAEDRLIRDIDESLTVFERALSAMDSLAAEISVDDWPARRAVLGKTLSSPLRLYRADLVQNQKSRRIRQEQKNAEEKEAAALHP